jgi:uncharacterized protein YjbJ (UPF0337 family)
MVGIRPPATDQLIEETNMGLGDKIKNAAEKAIGDAKEALGKLTNNSKLETEGKIDQGTADVKQAGEHVKDAIDEK